MDDFAPKLHQGSIIGFQGFLSKQLAFMGFSPPRCLSICLNPPKNIYIYIYI